MALGAILGPWGTLRVDLAILHRTSRCRAGHTPSLVVRSIRIKHRLLVSPEPTTRQ